MRGDASSECELLCGDRMRDGPLEKGSSVGGMEGRRRKERKGGGGGARLSPCRNKRETWIVGPANGWAGAGAGSRLARWREVWREGDGSGGVCDGWPRSHLDGRVLLVRRWLRSRRHRSRAGHGAHILVHATVLRKGNRATRVLGQVAAVLIQPTSQRQRHKQQSEPRRR